MSRNAISKSPPPQPLTGSQRQQRYRETQKLCSIDVSRTTLATLNALRIRIGTSTDKVIAAALERLITHLDEACSGGADLSRVAAALPAPPDNSTNNQAAGGSTEMSPGDTIGMHRSHLTSVGADPAPNRRGGGSRAFTRKPVVDQPELPLGHEPEDNHVNSDTSD